MPYIDIETIAAVDDPDNPRGPLGGLGPLPGEHRVSSVDSDLAPYDFGLTDAHVQELLAGLETRQVAVVVASTGTGKSTFLPYRLLYPPPGARLRLADRGPIIVTEPRRFAAIDTADFVATRLAQGGVGAGSEVGYRVKGEPAFDAACRLLYVTDGSLINWIRAGQLDRFGAIMIDEAHERSKNIDFILGVLRDALPRYPHLRVLIASATVDPDLFVEFFGGPDRVMRFEPPAPKLWGYGEPLWPMVPADDLVARERAKDWDRPGPNGENLRELAVRYASLRKIDKEIEAGQGYETWMRRMPSLVAKQVIAILKGTTEGHILAFLPGRKEIEEACAAIAKKVKSAPVDVLPLLATSAEDIQKRARGETADPGRRRVIVATNVAETSLTLPGVAFVVDSGLIRQSAWEVETASKHVPGVAHSQDGVRQRWGRVGRKAPGWVFPLYSEAQFKAFKRHTPEEAVRDDLEQFVLTAAACGVGDPEALTWPASVPRSDVDAAPREAFGAEMHRAVTALKARGAIDSEGDPTPLGLELQAFSGTMTEATAVVVADQLSCAIEMATAMQLLQGRRLVGHLLQFKWKWDVQRRDYARRKIEALRAGCLDDLDLALKIYAGWERAATDPTLGPDAERRQQAWAALQLVDHGVLVAARRGRTVTLEALSPGKKSTKVRAVLTELAPRVRAVLSFALRDVLFDRDGDLFQPRHGATSARGFALDPMATPVAGSTVLALSRRTPRTGPNLLANIVVDSALTDGEVTRPWRSLVPRAVAALRSKDGRPLGTVCEDHFTLSNTLPVGEVVGGEIVEAGTVASIRVDEYLGGVPQMTVPEEDESALDVDVEEDEDEEEEEETPELSTMCARAVLDLDQEPRFQDVTDQERSSEVPGGVGAQGLPDPAPAEVPAAPVGRSQPGSIARVRRANGQTSAAGKCYIRVIGYAGIGRDRVAVIESAADPRAVANEARIWADRRAAISLEVVECVCGWGLPYLACREVTTGHRVLIGHSDLTLFDRDVMVAESLPIGTRMQVTAMKWEDSAGDLIVSRIPQLVNEWKQVPRVRRVVGSTARNLVRARVSRVSPTLARAVIQSRVAGGAPSIRLGVPTYRLVKAGLLLAADEPFEDLDVLVGCRFSNDEGVLGYQWPNDELPSAAERACQGSREIEWDAQRQAIIRRRLETAAGVPDRLPGTAQSGRPSVVPGPQLPFRQRVSAKMRDRLARLSSEPDWQRRVWKWWLGMQKLELVQVVRADRPAVAVPTEEGVEAGGGAGTDRSVVPEASNLAEPNPGVGSSGASMPREAVAQRAAGPGAREVPDSGRRPAAPVTAALTPVPAGVGATPAGQPRVAVGSSPESTPGVSPRQGATGGHSLPGPQAGLRAESDVAAADPPGTRVARQADAQQPAFKGQMTVSGPLEVADGKQKVQEEPRQSPPEPCEKEREMLEQTREPAPVSSIGDHRNPATQAVHGGWGVAAMVASLVLGAVGATWAVRAQRALDVADQEHGHLRDRLESTAQALGGATRRIEELESARVRLEDQGRRLTEAIRAQDQEIQKWTARTSAVEADLASALKVIHDGVASLTSALKDRANSGPGGPKFTSENEPEHEGGESKQIEIGDLEVHVSPTGEVRVTSGGKPVDVDNLTGSSVGGRGGAMVILTGAGNTVTLHPMSDGTAKAGVPDISGRKEIFSGAGSSAAYAVPAGGRVRVVLSGAGEVVRIAKSLRDQVSVIQTGADNKVVWLDE